ncbi:MAG: 1-phosphofructokinase [Anaerolineae bacterium]|jgi:1-phosphofructokinase family hexose kinase
MIYTVTLNPALDRELTVPDLVFDEVLRATALRIDYGGKGFNVSRALAALGAESVALGFVGGKTGETLEAGLASLGIATCLTQVAEETRTNVSIVAENAAHHIKVNESGPTIAPSEQDTLTARVDDLARPGDWWVLSGNLPPGVSDTIYADLIERVHSAGARAILDTSGAPLRHGCEAGPFLAKPNAQEAADLTGLCLDALEDVPAAAEAIHSLGVEIVLTSLGKRGALLSDGDNTWMAEPPEIEERNPIGAGDASVAGLVWGLSQGLPLPDVLRWSMACGAAAASLDGTAVGTYTMVESLVHQVRIVGWNQGSISA